MTDTQNRSGTSDQPVQEKTYTTYNEFYEDIPLEGSLGILAMGAAGVIPWRIKRAKSGTTPAFVLPEKRTKNPEKADEKA